MTGLLREISRAKFLFIIFGAIGALLGYFGTESEEAVFEANASLVYRFNTEYFPRDIALSDWQGQPVRILVDQAIQTDLEIMGSRRVYSAAVKKAEDEFPGHRARMTNLSIRRVEGTSLVRVAFRHEQEYFATGFLKLLIDTYLDERERLFDNRSMEGLQAAKDAAETTLAQARESYDQLRTAPLPSLEEVRGQQTGIDQSPDATAQVPATNPANNTPDIRTARRESQLARLQMDVELATTNLRRISQMIAEDEFSRLLYQRTGPLIKVVDVPAVSTDPVSTTRESRAVVATLMGMMLAFVIAMTRAAISSLSPLRSGTAERRRS
ncbi:hypothetical protein [Silicimonas sp. MF1-12-2]|uniref:hypothetical protein n=1 Tax=Silicimonas sp. MF1-12-2 TaxID=3384793 RepID=UPI0039B5785D